MASVLLPRDVRQTLPVSLLDSRYDVGSFSGEMFVAGGGVRPHYRRRAAVDLAFPRRGVTFTVYSDSQGTERIVPFDLIPRIISATEWSRIEAGPVQRLTALNRFIDDIYHGQKCLKDKIVPAALIRGAKHFRR